jgi:hypothetical protein
VSCCATHSAAQLACCHPYRQAAAPPSLPPARPTTIHQQGQPPAFCHPHHHVAAGPAPTSAAPARDVMHVAPQGRHLCVVKAVEGRGGAVAAAPPLQPLHQMHRCTDMRDQ